MYDLILKKLKGIKDTALNFVGLGDKDPKDMSKEELAEYNKEKAEDRVKAAKRANKRKETKSSWSSVLMVLVFGFHYPT